MKKIYLVSIIAIIFSSIFATFPDYFKFLWGPQILSIPLATGIFMVLVQDEDKSYNYLPKLLIGSTLTCFVYAFIMLSISYIQNAGNNIYSFGKTVDLINISSIALPLIGLCLFGGLIGLVIRGTSLLLSKKK